MNKIYVAGHRGMVGSAIVRQLQTNPDNEILTRSRAELNLTSQTEVERFFATERPTQVYLAAATVGGIQANNSYPATFIYDNLMIEANVIHAAHQHQVQRLLFLGSSCIYPRLAEQPIREEALLTGPLEPTNEAYAVAKIAGIKLCESYNRQYGTDFRSAMPTNLYGPGDNFNLADSHVVPALLRKFHSAKVNAAEHVTIWGSGKPKREFLHVDDMAEACLHIMRLSREDYQAHTQAMLSHINVGCGTDIRISELATLIGQVVGYTGRLQFDRSKPDGAPRKLLDTARLTATGWRPRTELLDGLRQTYAWFVEHEHQVRSKTL